MPLTKKQNLARARHRAPLLAAARALHEHAIVRHLPVQRHIPLANALEQNQATPRRRVDAASTYRWVRSSHAACTAVHRHKLTWRIADAPAHPIWLPPRSSFPLRRRLPPPLPPTCCPLFLFLHTTAIHLYSCARVYRHMQCMHTSKCSLLFLLPLSLLSRSRARALSLTHAHQHTHDLNHTQP